LVFVADFPEKEDRPSTFCHACGKSGLYKMHKHSFGYFGEELRRPHFLPNAMEIMIRLMGFTSVGGNESQFIFLANALWFL